MKIIDLLNKISNGEEVPNRVRFDNIEWNRVYGEKNVYYIDEYDNDLFIHFFRKNLDFTLNDEVEIIEEEKKIPEKLDLILDEQFTNDELQAYIYETQEKVNQVIDYLKSKGE